MIPSPMFFVEGDPATQGSMRAVRLGKHARLINDNERTLPWRGTIAATARSCGWGRELLDGPIAVALVFVLQRKASDFDKKGRVRAKSDAFPLRKKDVDKLTRAALDALTGVVWRDDSRVVVSRPAKVFGNVPGVLVVIHPIVDVQPGTADVFIDPGDPSTLIDLARVALTYWPAGAAVEAVARAPKVTPQGVERVKRTA